MKTLVTGGAGFIGSNLVKQLCKDGHDVTVLDNLQLFREKLGHFIEILPDETFRCDRSLDSTRFRREFNYKPPTWEAMVEELKNNK